MPYTLNQAAKACNRGKATILNALQKGRLSATKDEFGNWQIDPAELSRLYPLTGLGAGQQNQDLPPAEHQNDPKIRELEASLKAMAELLEQVKGERDRAREDAAEWRKTITALLPPPKAEQAPEPEKVGFWARVFGRSAA